MPAVRPAARRLSSAAIALCLVALVASAPASGARRAPRVATAGAITTAESIAASHWGSVACAGKVEIAWRARPRLVSAVSSWSNRLNPYDDAQGNFDCRVEFNPRATWTWAKFCTVLVHEFGHLTGHRHSSDPHDVMSPVLVDPLPACTAVRPSPA